MIRVMIRAMSPNRTPPPGSVPHATPFALVILAWAAVSLPLLWGILQTLKKAAPLFR